ncbi:hypothetical protein O0L34_g6262 [Tuta absoluta]|nr:hypothetical protein O0L34_g6262 [Tuta absoluta]
MQAQMAVGNELQRSYRMQDFATPGVIMRERSFVRPQSHHNMHHTQFPNHGKRRSMILTNAKGKPTLEIYRPPGVRTDGVAATTGGGAAATSNTNKLNVHAKEFTMAKPADHHNRPAMGMGYTSVGLQHSRSAVLHAQVPPHYRPVMPHSAALLNSQSSGNVPQAVSVLQHCCSAVQHYLPVMPHSAALLNSQSSGNVPQAVSVLQHCCSAVQHYLPVMPHSAALLNSQSSGNVPQAVSVLQHCCSAVPHYQPVMPHSAALLNSQSSGNVPQASGPRVHFKLQPQTTIISEKKKSPPSSLTNGNGKSIRPQAFTPGLKRSKSLTSADTLASGMAALGLAADAGDLGSFPPDIQECIDKALEDPNAVSARTLMDAVGHLVSRAVESPRYALPAARRCISVVEHELTETFLESLLNTCQQWYHDRERLLGAVVGGGRPRLMAFLSFLLEMYCQLRRRAIQRRGGASAQPGQVLLTLICKCCEDCIRQAVPSPSDTENLFFVLTYIGRDLESQLPGELERLLSAVRDAFLQPAAPPSIRRTLLQLIELHASRWQLPGQAVLYYYPSSK